FNVLVTLLAFASSVFAVAIPQEFEEVSGLQVADFEAVNPAIAEVAAPIVAEAAPVEAAPAVDASDVADVGAEEDCTVKNDPSKSSPESN
ncbi:hypothetical protein HDU97_009266, partial [Phlyctochytrium planicorne]